MSEETTSSKITEIEISCVRVPLEEPVFAPGLLIDHRDYLLARIRCADGTRGIGFSYIATFGGGAALAMAQEIITENLIGWDPADPTGVQSELMRMTRILGRGGPIMNIISAIDIALWDRNARAAELPLYRFLGAPEIETVPAYASGGYLRPGEGNDVLEKELAGYLDAGFQRIKIKTAHGSFKDDVERVERARRIVGDDVALMFDAYCNFADIETATKHIQKYTEVSPYWIEDPFEPDEWKLYAELANKIEFSVATGEFYYNSAPFIVLADRSALNVIQAESPRCGGITGWLKIAALADQYEQIELCPCWYHDIHIHLVAASEKATMVEYFPDDRILNFRQIIDSPIENKDGALLLPSRPGLGFDFLEDKLEQFNVARPHVVIEQ